MKSMEANIINIICLSLLLASPVIYQVQGSAVVEDSINKSIIRNETLSNFRDSNTYKNMCNLSIKHESIVEFRRQVYYNSLNFVYLRLIPDDNITLTATKYIIQGNVWTWTYFGKTGALEYLKWPQEFQIWSLGLLSSTVYGVLPIQLERVSGNCTDLQIGDRNESDKIIGEALKQLADDLHSVTHDDLYGASFFCYKRRLFIESQLLYVMCTHVVCAIESIYYHCCKNTYDRKYGKRVIDCTRRVDFVYDEMWRIGPVVLAVILCAYMPLLFLFIFSRFSGDLSDMRSIRRESLQPIMQDVNDTIVFYDGSHHITLINTLFSCIINACGKRQHLTSRLFRFILPMLSLSFIAIQCMVDYINLHEFVLSCIEQGVPMGFRSMQAGYSMSKDKFLSYFGGPFISIAVYLTLTCFALAIPRSISKVLENGLVQSRGNIPSGLLWLGLRHVEQFGNVRITKQQGILKLYNTFLAQFYMLLNPRFWKFCFKIQKIRWRCITDRKIYSILFPFYCIVCLLELLLCGVINGVPFFTLSLTTIKAYTKPLYRSKNSTTGLCSCISAIFGILCIPFAVACVLFSLSMFCLIFLDACLFMTRIFIFTYTGIVVYPKNSYGYIIFFLTTVFYFWNCLNEFALYYDHILKTTIKVSKTIDRRNNCRLVYLKNGNKGVQLELLNHVIEYHMPQRKKAFLSLLKLTLLLFFIGLSLYLLTKMDRLSDIHIFVHVITALFTCALPQIVTAVFTRGNDSFHKKRFQRQIAIAVYDYQGRNANEENSTSNSEDY